MQIMFIKMYFCLVALFFLVKILKVEDNMDYFITYLSIPFHKLELSFLADFVESHCDMFFVRKTDMFPAMTPSTSWTNTFRKLQDPDLLQLHLGPTGWTTYLVY